MTTEPIDAEFSQTQPTAAPAPTATTSNALVATENPFQGMAVMAMQTGHMDQMERLLDLQLRWDAEQQRKAFTAAMAAFKAEPIKITKGKLVEFTTRDGDTTSYRHATLADVVDAVVRGMGRHGLSHRWDVQQEGGQVSVTCTITHCDGHSESVTMQAAPDTSGKKNSIQQVASSVTYLQRYTLMAATGVAAADMDDDDGRAGGAEQVAYITEEQVKILDDLTASYVNNRDAFIRWVRKAVGNPELESFDKVPARSFDVVHNQLAALRKQKQEKDGGA